jgi:hypothetical protein
MYADEDTFVNNVRQVIARFRKQKIIVNLKKTQLGLEEVEYVGHLVSHKGVSFTKRNDRKYRISNVHVRIRRCSCALDWSIIFMITYGT